MKMIGNGLFHVSQFIAVSYNWHLIHKSETNFDAHFLEKEPRTEN